VQDILARRGSAGQRRALALAKWHARAQNRAFKISGMKGAYPPVGSKWKEVDTRVKRTVEVIRHDVANGRVRINCLETQKLTWAKPERFNGKSGGYQRAD
jgi:hypothetical protein